MPEDWKTVTIDDISHGVYDGPHATPDPAEEGPIFLGIKNLTEDGHLDFSDVRHISEEEYPRWTRRVTPRYPDIVFTYEATLHRYAIIPQNFRGCLGRRVALIRPDTEKVEPCFLLYYFFGRQWRAEANRYLLRGATVDRIPVGDFPDFEVELPPLPVQRRIAEILGAYDDLIENNRRRIEILEEMASRIFREWFVHYRYPGHEDDDLRDSPLGMIPADWEVKALGDVCHLILGTSPKSEFYNEEGDGPPFHQGVRDFGVRYPQHVRFCSKEKRIAEDGDILFSVRAPVGRINIADQRVVIGRGIHAIRSKTGHQWFVFHQLKNRFFEEDLIGSGTIYKSVTKKDIMNLDLLIPSSELISEFEQKASNVEGLIRNLTFRNRTLAETRDLLLPRLVSGEIEVEEVEGV